MRKIQIVLICAVCLFFVISTVTAQKVKNTMTNSDVVEMVKGGLAESTIILAIQQSEPNFDTSPKTLIELSKQGVTQKILDAMLQPQTPITKPSSQNRPEIVNAIATKDIGSLRVALKSIVPIKLDNESTGIRLSFEFINLEPQKPIVVAMNAFISNGNCDLFIGNYLRSTLVDESGGVWYLKNPDVSGGIGKVGVGWSGRECYDPAQIVTLLSKRDDLKSDKEGQYNFIHGEMTEMSPGQSITVTMTFAQNNNQTNSGTPSKVFQMATEIVVGVLTSGTKKSYTLYNLIFDRVTR